MATVSDLAQAIAQFEGFNTVGSAQRNNNPGNLRSWGSYPVVNGFAQFPDAASGWAALESQVQTNVNRGLTLSEFFGGKPGVYAGYAPAADSNSPSSYAATVAGWLGISTDVPLSDALNGSGSNDTGSGSTIDWASLTSSPSLPLIALAIGAVALGWMLLRRD